MLPSLLRFNRPDLLANSFCLPLYRPDSQLSNTDQHQRSPGDAPPGVNSKTRPVCRFIMNNFIPAVFPVMSPTCCTVGKLRSYWSCWFHTTGAEKVRVKHQGRRSSVQTRGTVRLTSGLACKSKLRSFLKGNPRFAKCCLNMLVCKCYG